MEPVPGGPSFPPGCGPVELCGQMAGHRVYVRRDPARERRRALELLLDVGLDPAVETSPFRHRLSGESALDLVRRLQAHVDRGEVRVLWPTDRRLVVHEGTLSALSLSVSRRRDWFQIQGGLRVAGEFVELALLLDAVRAGRRYVPVGRGVFCRLEEALRDRLERTLGLVDSDAEGTLEVSPGAAGRLAHLLSEAEVTGAPEAWERLKTALADASRNPVPVPADLNARLRPYQEEGFRWMARLSGWARGGVLADDMGLGKTVQTIAFLLHRRGKGPAVVVAPTSVLPNWVREIRRFAPPLRPHLLAEHRGEARRLLLGALGGDDVLLVSYGLAAREADLLASRQFGTLVLDEAQALKNPTSERTRALRRVDAGFRLALTGTPVENNLGELWSLFSVVFPGLLGPARRFRKRFVLPIERDGDASRRRQLSRLLRPMLLRRTKRQVVRELPPKVEMDVAVILSDEERRLYEQTRLAAVARLSGRETPGGSEAARRMEVLAAITRLRLLACAPVLAFPEVRTPSSKIARFLEIAQELKTQGHRALVFSQFTRFLGLVRQAAEARGLSGFVLDGSTPPRERGALVDRFQAGEGDLFFISLRAGGTGLNLTGADHVVHLDPWWNPALEDQATDRAYRIGQRRSVTVLRLVARGTIEEQIRQLHAEKRALLEALLEGTSRSAHLSVEELEGLLVEGAEAFGPTAAPPPSS